MKISSGDLEQINSGCNSAIYKFQDNDNKQRLVLKTVLAANKKQADHLINQYQYLSRLHHQNIISPLLFKTNIPFLQGPSHMLVLEFATHGCLLDFVKRRTLSVEEGRYIFRFLAKAVNYLHSQNIAHRDLKLENVLVFQKEDKLLFKIADFGFADATLSDFNGKEKLIRGIKGTKRGYMAPEIHISLQQKQGYSAKNTDIFALGVMLFAIIFRKLPFEYATKQNIIYKHIWENNFQAFWNHHSKDLNKKIVESPNICMDDLKHLLQGMLCRDPKNRYQIQEIVDHPWLQSETKPPSP